MPPCRAPQRARSQAGGGSGEPLKTARTSHSTGGVTEPRGRRRGGSTGRTKSRLGASGMASSTRAEPEREDNEKCRYRHSPPAPTVHSSSARANWRSNLGRCAFRGPDGRSTGRRQAMASSWASPSGDSCVMSGTPLASVLQPTTRPCASISGIAPMFDHRFERHEWSFPLPIALAAATGSPSRSSPSVTKMMTLVLP